MTPLVRFREPVGKARGIALPDSASAEPLSYGKAQATPVHLLYLDSSCLCTIHNCNSMFREPHSTFLWVLGFAYFMADSDHMQMDTEPQINLVFVALLPHSAHLFSS